MHLDKNDERPESAEQAAHAGDDGPEKPTRQVRFFAAARDAAGVSSTYVAAGTVEELADALISEYGEPLGRVIAISSLLVDGQVLAIDGPRGRALPGLGAVDVLPPFAGG